MDRSFKESPVIRFFLPFNRLQGDPDRFYRLVYKKGENIVKQNTPLTHFLILESGVAKVHFNYLKRDFVMLLLTPGQMVGSPGFLVDNKHRFSVTALKKTTVWMLDVSYYLELLKSEPDAVEGVIRYLNQVHGITYDRMLSLGLKSMYGRVADTLIYLADHVYHSDVYDMDLNRRELAEFCALSMESVVRILKHFNKAGIIICQNRHVEILDRPRLERIE